MVTEECEEVCDEGWEEVTGVVQPALASPLCEGNLELDLSISARPSRRRILLGEETDHMCRKKPGGLRVTAEDLGYRQERRWGGQFLEYVPWRFASSNVDLIC